MQSSFGNCLDEFAAKPDLIPSFNGTVAEIEHAKCMPSVFAHNISTNGLSKINPSSVETLTKIPHTRNVESYDVAFTPNGRVLLPKEREVTQYLPTASTLNFLTTSVEDTRLQPYPVRYYH